MRRWKTHQADAWQLHRRYKSQSSHPCPVRQKNGPLPCGKAAADARAPRPRPLTWAGRGGGRKAARRAARGTDGRRESRQARHLLCPVCAQTQPAAPSPPSQMLPPSQRLPKKRDRLGRLLKRPAGSCAPGGVGWVTGRRAHGRLDARCPWGRPPGERLGRGGAERGVSRRPVAPRVVRSGRGLQKKIKQCVRECVGASAGGGDRRPRGKKGPQAHV